jgi:hypothetical protein
MYLEDLIPVVLGFVLGLLGGPAKDFFTDKRRARRLARMIDVELESLASRASDTARRLQLVTGAASWYERSIAFTRSWFWNQTDTLALLDKKTLTQIVVLRGILEQLEADYREIEQDVGADGRMFPREHVLGKFDQLRSDIQSRTSGAVDLISQIRRH